MRTSEKRRKRRESEQHLVDLVVKEFEASDKVYGCRKLWKEVIKTENVSEWKYKQVQEIKISSDIKPLYERYDKSRIDEEISRLKSNV